MEQTRPRHGSWSPSSKPGQLSCPQADPSISALTNHPLARRRSLSLCSSSDPAVANEPQLASGPAPRFCFSPLPTVYVSSGLWLHLPCSTDHLLLPQTARSSSDTLAHADLGHVSLPGRNNLERTVALSGPLERQGRRRGKRGPGPWIPCWLFILAPGHANSRASYLTCLCFSFLICEMRVIARASP